MSTSESELSSATFRETFLNQERVTRDVVLVRRIFIVMAGSIADGTLLSQIVYWYLPDKYGRSKLRVKRRGHMWIAKQHKEWYDEICMTERQAKTAIKRLSDKGLLITAGMLFNAKRTTHIRIDWDEFEKQYQRAKSYLLTPKVPNWSDRKYQTGPTESTKLVRPLTETTSEITPEITGDGVGQSLKKNLAAIGFTADKIKPFLNGIDRAEVEKWLLIVVEGVKLGKVKNPPGYLRDALANHWEAPPWYAKDDPARRYQQGQFADFWDA